MHRRGEEDEEEECEEEGRAAHKLKEVKRAAGSATVHRFLQEERHEGQELEEELRGKQTTHKHEKPINVHTTQQVSIHDSNTFLKNSVF